MESHILKWTCLDQPPKGHSITPSHQRLIPPTRSPDLFGVDFYQFYDDRCPPEVQKFSFSFIRSRESKL